ncbi:hypothetical protein, partial [Rubrimonas cliftonensis]|uniref:hypothetical protein n=1 Tax=Rubrimonas cliftonensis TaxID=89524 RepID=UPI001C315AC1
MRERLFTALYRMPRDRLGTVTRHLSSAAVGEDDRTPAACANGRLPRLAGRPATGGFREGPSLVSFRVEPLTHDPHSFGGVGLQYPRRL